MLREETHIFVRGEAALWLEAFVQPQKAKRHLVLLWSERERERQRGEQKPRLNSLFMPGGYLLPSVPQTQYLEVQLIKKRKFKLNACFSRWQMTLAR